MLEEGSGLREGNDFHLVFSPRAGAHRPRLRRPAPVPQARRRPVRRGAPRRRWSSTRRCSTSTSGRPAAAQRRVGPRLGRGVRAGQARRDHLPRRQHRPGQPVRPVRRHEHGIDVTTGHRGVATPSRTATSTSPGIAVGGHCIPVYPRLYLWNDPDGDRRARRPRGQCRDAGVRGRRCSPPRYGDLAGAARRSCWARRTAAGSRRRRSPACSRPSRRCAPRGADVARARPDVLGDEELARSASAATTWASRSTPRSCRPTTPSTARSAPPTCPGVRVLVDGRNVTDARRGTA